jgi:CBS-domain-containing membrane protein
MTSKPITVKEDTPLDEVVHLLETHNIKRLPVLRRGRTIGIVTRANLMRALARIHHAAGRPLKSDAEIRDRILKEIDKQTWSAGALVDVAVRKGVVDLWGSISDASQRNALKVLAENANGVKRVCDHLGWRDEPISVS